MKMYSAILLSALLGGSMAQASINFDMRADYLSSQYDKTSANADNSKFVLNVMRVDAKGKLSDSVDYRLRFRLSSNRTVATRDSLGADTDYAYISNKLHDGLVLTVGKFASDAGGQEGITAGPDLYMTSQAYSDANVGTSSFRYYTGAKLAYTFEGQEIALHVTNLNTDASGPGNNGSAGKFNQDKNMTGLVYKGSFMDKKLTPIVSYHMQSGKASGAGVDDDNAKSKYLAAGIKYDVDAFSVEADYLSNVLGSLTTVSQDDKLDTMVLGGSYKMNQWIARLKMESSVQKTETSATAETKSTYTGYQAAVEYVPVKEEMFRYHVAYYSKDTKTETAASSVTTTDKFILVGTRIMADFLK